MSKQTDYTLIEAPAGAILKVVSLLGGSSLRSRLYSLGIMPGTELEVFPNCHCGASRRVKVRGSSLILGAGMAEKIICHLLAEAENVGTPCECSCQPTLEETIPFQSTTEANMPIKLQ